MFKKRLNSYNEGYVDALNILLERVEEKLKGLRIYLSCGLEMRIEILQFIKEKENEEQFKPLERPSKPLKDAQL